MFVHISVCKCVKDFALFSFGKQSFRGDNQAANMSSLPYACLKQLVLLCFYEY